MRRTTDLARDGIAALSIREKETLRLLLRGHDAKSIARDLGLSVHTINERLRDARRKLDASSSREAARRLAEAERASPEYLGDDLSRVSGAAPAALPTGQADHRRDRTHRLAWLSGGMLIMSLLIAAVALLSITGGTTGHGARGTDAVPANPYPTPAAQAAARAWLGALDRGDWEASWRSAAGLFKSRITGGAWAATIQPIRQPLGRTAARAFQAAARAGTLPGVPAGEYEIIEFRTDFAGKAGAVETITMARDAGGWKVAGYFIR